MVDMVGQEVTFKEAEEAVLGAMLLYPPAVDACQKVLTVNDFESIGHQVLYETILKLSADAIGIEYASVVTELRNTGRLALVGGQENVGRLLSVGIPYEVKYFADLVKDFAGVRRIHNFHRQGLERTTPGSGSSYSDVLNSTMADLNDLTDGNHVASDLTSVQQLMPNVFDTIEEAERQAESGVIMGIPSGLVDLDRATTGFRAGQMIVIAARPGIGKSTLGLDIASNAAIKHNLTTAVFSLEMSSDEIMTRLLSSYCHVDLGVLRSGKLTDAHWNNIGVSRATLEAAPLYIDETPNITMAEIRAKCRHMKNRDNLQLVVIDYLQLMGSSKIHNSREQEVSGISRQIKILAKELKIPIVVMAQLNRASEHRAGGKPVLSDLRESGAIEQDSDIVIFIHREDKIDEDSTRIGEADLIIAKQRNGPVTTIPVAFQGHLSRFVNLSHTPEPDKTQWNND